MKAYRATTLRGRKGKKNKYQFGPERKKTSSEGDRVTIVEQGKRCPGRRGTARWDGWEADKNGRERGEWSAGRAIERKRSG